MFTPSGGEMGKRKEAAAREIYMATNELRVEKRRK